MVTRGEAITAAVGWRAAGRTTIRTESAADGACPFLKADGSCANYRHRPLGCRTHFCDAAGGTYPRSHVIDAIRELESLDEELGGNGPRPLPTAAQEAMDQLPSKKKRR